ncbi:MAG: energy transducer TonB [Pyrinomonadaceae bacterium]
MKHIGRIFLILLLAVFGGGAVFGQTVPFNDASYAAPVSWIEYQIPSQKISLVFPKLPVARNESNVCSQTDSTQYHAYANGVVYEFGWYAKSNAPIPSACSKKTKFSKALFTDRVNRLKASNYVESKGTVAGISAIVLRSSSIERTRWLIWVKDRWFELGITHRTGTNIDEARLLNGFKISSSTGVDVGAGALRTLGDSNVELPGELEAKKSSGLTIVAKPKASYTELARRADIQGSVMLRVTFLRNGGIGAISVVKSLPYGLTEQAIAAARKLSFLPAIADGQPVHVTKQVEYSFSIY